jgi:hypothetical protein
VPFTVSHAAAVLPLQRFGKYRLPLSALMVGSMAPDFGYFYSAEMSRQLTHTIPALFTFCLPAGLFGWFFYIVVLEKATITLLSDRWHTRFAHTDAITAPLILRACIAIVIGAITHLVWDSFTHRATIVTNAIPALNLPTPGLPWLPIYSLLHALSSVVGVVILAHWARHLHRQPAKSLIRPFRISERARNGAIGFLVVASLAVGLIDWLPYRYDHYSAQFFYLFVGLSSGFFVAWCGVAIGMWIHARRDRSPRD